METLFKFGELDPESPYLYPDVWAEGITTAGSRLVIAPAKGQIDVLIHLLQVMPEPMWLLYVLVVPRTDDQPGRYQSPEPQTRTEVAQFLKKFEAFFETDGRHHLWIASAHSPALLVYDRHNIIYGYGLLDAFKACIAEMNMRETTAISIPAPHSHYYHEHFDRDATRLIAIWDWHHTPLRESDSE